MLTIAKYDRYDLVNTPQSDKAAFTVWFSGCSIGCPECYNKKLWDKSAGKEHDVYSVIFAISRECDRNEIDNVVLLGGEPMEQEFESLSILVKKLTGYGYKIWLYTGWELDAIPQSIKEYLYTIKCGVYDETLKCDGIPSSTNQRFYRKDSNNQWKEITFIESR